LAGTQFSGRVQYVVRAHENGRIFLMDGDHVCCRVQLSARVKFRELIQSNRQVLQDKRADICGCGQPSSAIYQLKLLDNFLYSNLQ
jgi:hypothetical protein